MLIETKNTKPVRLSKLNLQEIEPLAHYLHELSPDTKKRFGPHQFDKDSLFEFYSTSNQNCGYVAYDIETGKIIAYSIIKIGFLEHDSERLSAYGLQLSQTSDCTFAPSVADAWQSMGLGNKLFQFIISDLKTQNINRIILWGGVQAGNEKAVNYYLKNGFSILGNFHYNGDNYDMAFEIR
jgi:GNAT superfamily N-acetyltransferase